MPAEHPGESPPSLLLPPSSSRFCKLQVVAVNTVRVRERERDRDQLVASGAVDRRAELNWLLLPSPVHPTDRQRHQFPTHHLASVRGFMFPLFCILFCTRAYTCVVLVHDPFLCFLASSLLRSKKRLAIGTEQVGERNRVQWRPISRLEIDMGTRKEKKVPLLPLRGGGVWPLTRTCNPVALSGPSCLPNH
ncbi:hypothetical protein MUK42_12034 [Musa troglodytarum]|uniref:Uncharacterized protein n=1 Tax=Musa troglodytarum TaxID=320322 RepID=A0A9E7FEC8_9LILI|nr:hypothetical protein MUK42_12034 [Musa troglodytarum]